METLTTNHKSFILKDSDENFLCGFVMSNNENVTMDITTEIQKILSQIYKENIMIEQGTTPMFFDKNEKYTYLHFVGKSEEYRREFIIDSHPIYIL